MARKMGGGGMNEISGNKRPTFPCLGEKKKGKQSFFIFCQSRGSNRKALDMYFVFLES